MEGLGSRVLVSGLRVWEFRGLQVWTFEVAGVACQHGLAGISGAPKP